MSDLCLICHSQDLLTWSIGKKGRSYIACRRCEFVSLNPQYRISSELEKQRYLEHNNDATSSDYLNYVQGNFQNIEKMALSELKSAKGSPANISVLDFGCGREPILANLLKKDGYSVFLYDRYFFDGIEYLNETYDIVLLIEVIEHLADPRAKLLELKKRLKPGGKVLIRTEPLTFEEQFFKRWWYPGDKTHISFFNERSMRSLAATSGIKVESVQGPFFVLT